MSLAVQAKVEDCQNHCLPDYLLLIKSIKETGPTIVGDEHSDEELMRYLGAEKTTMLGSNFSEFRVRDPPRLVLDKLEAIGYSVISMTGLGQTLVWCLHKASDKS
ncbi:GTP cyclohydrolase 1 feedback regulatory protein isoform X1 [Hemiscyllium ocellatum]|uniref:GTP cyclohydrolase 1 feedback regulatory protein isoform X1 n=1 Tax=Hemiscyllium ocellatum TaxID=170820 RepID=UPI00296689A9|nr:GTP cyclohydrolase 1 feedback regulatory protein isoform X1 [Hemiscyllium ocellatum]